MSPNDFPPEERVEEAIWWQRDAAYLYRWIVFYRDTRPWMAVAIQRIAQHSACKARECMGLEPLTP